jgi:hypothetical protein
LRGCVRRQIIVAVDRERAERRPQAGPARETEARAPTQPVLKTIRMLQRHAGNRATTALLQRRWLVNDREQFFWEEDGTTKTPAPTWLEPRKEIAPPLRGTYQVDDGSSPQLGRSKPLYYTLDRRAEMLKIGSRAAAGGGVFNPFNRMATAAVSSFLPGGELKGSAADATLAALKDKDPTYKPIIEHSKERNADGYPVQVKVEGNQTLHFVQAGTFGAVYASTAPSTEVAQPDPERAKDPELLGLSGPHPDAKIVWNWKIEPSSLRAWSGKKRKISQADVMGASAGDAAENAGFDRNEGQGWEWLHLIAHSMGGIESRGPQVPDNLVAGTSECNSQMIVTEEWIKDVITKSGGHAALSVIVDMFDAQRHIGRRIGYDFELYNEKGGPTAVYHVEFDPLSRRQPLAQINREERYAAREQHPKGEPASTSYTPRSQPTTHSRFVASDDPITKFIDSAIAILQQAGVDAFHAYLQPRSRAAGGEGIPPETFDEVGRLISDDSVLRYLTALRRERAFGTDTAVRRVVGGYLEMRVGRQDWMLDEVLVPLYHPQPVPDSLKQLCAPGGQRSTATQEVSADPMQGVT